MGGAIAEGNVTPAAEFNIWADPEAAARVFASGIDVTMIGLDVTHKALFTPAHVRSPRPDASARWWRSCSEFYGHFHREVYNFDGSPIHDAVAVAHVIRADLVKTELLNTEIDVESELCRGRTVVDVWRRSGREPNAHVGVDIDADGFLELLVERLNSLAVSLVFAAIAPHGTLPEAPVDNADATHAALATLGERFDAARPDATIVHDAAQRARRRALRRRPRRARSPDRSRSSTRRRSGCPVQSTSISRADRSSRCTTTASRSSVRASAPTTRAPRLRRWTGAC